MPRVLELATIDAIRSAIDGEVHDVTPPWLMRPGRAESAGAWTLVCEIYGELTGLKLPDTMPLRERRQVDAILEIHGKPPRIFEFDESQHFNVHRAATLSLYPRDLALGFPLKTWLEASQTSTRKLGTTGGWGKPKPPLFPEPGGRHQQRAFRDALADLLPAAHGWGPTVRIADFEVSDWIHGTGATERIGRILTSRT